MTFDSQEQKNLVLQALSEFPCKLGQAQGLLRIAEAITKGEVVPPKKSKKK